MLGFRTVLHVQHGTMAGQIYRDISLQQHVRLFMGAIGTDFVFMDDNAHPHRGSILNECLEEEDIARLEWSSFSPVLNPIEHAWEMLGRQVTACHPPSTSLRELHIALSRV